MGFVFQSFNLIDDLTVAENVEVALIYLRVPSAERRQRIAAALERVDVAHRARSRAQATFRRPATAGRRARARSWRSPKLILADEPTGNLDSANGEAVMDMLTSIVKGGTTLVMVTHSEDTRPARTPCRTHARRPHGAGRGELTAVVANYLAAGLRNLLRNRVHAAINLVGLSVGFAAALIIALYVRSELSHDRFFPGHRDVYLLTETKDMQDRRLITERWDFSFPDLAAKLGAQFPQDAVHCPNRAGEKSAAHPSRPRSKRMSPASSGRTRLSSGSCRSTSLAGDLQTALAMPDSVVRARTAARKYFGRDTPLGEVLEVNPAMGADATKVFSAFGTSHPMRVTAVIEDLPSNSYLKGEVFGSSLASYSLFALYDLTQEQGPFRLDAYTFIRLRPGASLQQVREDLAAYANAIRRCIRLGSP